MKVFKFGGASVKDAQAVKNVVDILKLYHRQKLLIVISAMGKTTNALEEIIDALWNKNQEVFNEKINFVKNYHLSICKDLFTEQHTINDTISTIFEQLKTKINQEISENYNYEYDQIVSLGEIVSTMIVCEYINQSNLSTKWIDARKIVRTNQQFRDADPDWNKTEELIKKNIVPLFDKIDIVVTQGFIGHTAELSTTTLGREGSDFSAGIFAYCLNAESVTIWKDVPGMLNADPKYFENTVKLEKISFHEAIELSYYGASVIHPKTLKPLQNKNIPLYVKSFIQPNLEGSIIQSSTEYDHLIPSFIFKKEQTLISFKTRDFSFIAESNLSDIFDKLSSINLKINLMQNSALSFSILVDTKKLNINKLMETFHAQYEIRYNESLELITIRHYNQETIEQLTKNKEILLEQYTRQTARIVVK